MRALIPDTFNVVRTEYIKDEMGNIIHPPYFYKKYQDKIEELKALNLPYDKIYLDSDFMDNIGETPLHPRFEGVNLAKLEVIINI